MTIRLLYPFNFKTHKNILMKILKCFYELIITYTAALPYKILTNVLQGGGELKEK